MRLSRCRSWASNRSWSIRNPETVSTDYDTSNRLYFEPLTLEHVLNICDVTEKPDGVIVQFGGQTPLNLALLLKRLGVPIIGTDPSNIDLGRGSQAVWQTARRAQYSVPREWHVGNQCGRGMRSRPPHRLPGSGAPQLDSSWVAAPWSSRTRRDGSPIHARGRVILAGASGAGRSLS